MKIAAEEYWKGHRSLIAALLGVSHTVVDESDGLLDGFLCTSRRKGHGGEPIIHYVYVRLSARGRGVARGLISTIGPADRILYTHRSRRLVQRRLPKGFRYDPYQLYWSLTA